MYAAMDKTYKLKLAKQELKHWATSQIKDANINILTFTVYTKSSWYYYWTCAHEFEKLCN